ncbi:cell wall-binding repeat-containing protein [Leifsonia aquatica]|uniref:cell wall-binding repeat-containing protein n=1 Tax=Leifsonia aquatica TaxID=144185 RepID=UPI00384A4B0F
MRDRAAASVPVTDSEKAAPPARRRRLLATVAVAALTAGAVAASGVPASANPGISGYEEAFNTPVAGGLGDVAVDSYTAQIFASRGGAVDVLDEASGAILTSIPLPGSVTVSLDVDPSRALVWALDSSSRSLSRIDERTNTVTGSVVIPGDPRDVAVDATTGKVFVTTGTLGTVVPVDEKTLAVGAAVPAGAIAGRIGVDPTAGTLYVVNGAGNSVTVIDESSSAVSGVVTIPSNTVAITVDGAHHKAYLGSADFGAVTVVDGSALTTSSIAVPPGGGLGVTALGIDPSTQTVIGRSGSEIFRVDTETGAVRSWNNQGTNVTTPDIAVDVFTNTVIYGASTSVVGHWEPVSFLGSVSGVVPAGTPYTQQVNVWSWAFAFPIGLSVTSGALPPGLSLNDGTITGTATTPGTYTFSLKATVPDFGDSVTQTYTLRVVNVKRTSGGDRFGTSVEVSKAAYPDPASVGTVYVANGLSFPDALSGGPAAAQDSGPLLLTAPGYLPDAVKAEITRLHPAHIVVVGGPAVVSADVLTALGRLSPDVKRVYGGDRFDTSRQVAAYTFTSAPTVYVSTGLNFPDSLSAGAAAGSLHAPLLLVNGNATSVDASTASLLTSLGTNKIVVIGGPAVMSPALVADFGRFGTVIPLAGGDRFDTSQQIVEASFANSSRVVLANGLNFPDALSASAWAGKTASPLFITPGGCVPQRTLDDTYFLGATDVTVAGGSAVQGSGVTALTSCGGWSIIAPAYPALAPEKAASQKSADEPAVGGHAIGSSLPVNPLTHGTAGR